MSRVASVPLLTIEHWFFEWLPGHRFYDLMVQPGFNAKVFSETGMALAELHRQDDRKLTGATSWSPTNLCNKLKILGHLSPKLARRANELGERLSRLIEKPTNSMRTIQGDFTADNILLTKDSVVVIDFDSAARGDPAIDLGNSIAILERRAVLGHISPLLADVAEEALLEGYRCATRGSVPACPAAYAAVRLCRATLTPFKRRLPNWPDVAETLLARAETLVRKAEPEALTSRREFSVPIAGSEKKVIRQTAQRGSMRSPSCG